MQTGKEIRLRRIWKHRRTVIIPFDHGQYGGVMKGLEDPCRLTERISRTKADAVLVTPGVLENAAGQLGELGVILRLDGGFTKYSVAATDYEPVCSVEQAVRLGVDAGIVFTFVGTSFDGKSLSRLGRTVEDAARWGLPLVSEILPPSLLNNHFERQVFRKHPTTESLEEETQTVSRIAAEHGADVIKTRYSGSAQQFRTVVETCGARVIVAGGPNTSKSDEELLKFAHDCVEADAAGIVFGRCVWQHPKMEKLVAALCAIVHEEESIEKAIKLLK